MAGTANFTHYGKNKFIDAILRGQSLGAPATWHVGLSIGAVTAGGVAVEPAGAWYDRVAVTASLANFSGTQGAGTTTASNGTTGQSSNNIQVNFADPTASGDQVTHWFLADAASGGNIWLYGEITDDTGAPVSITLNAGQPLFFGAGNLRITAP